MKILYIDDDKLVLDLAQAKLQDYYDVYLASTDVQAWLLLTAHGPSLSAILMDIELSGSELDGLALTRVIRGDYDEPPVFAMTVPVLKDVPIIFVTAHAGTYEGQDRFGGHTVIRKPIEFFQLTQTLTKLALDRSLGGPHDATKAQL